MISKIMTGQQVDPRKLDNVSVLSLRINGSSVVTAARAIINQDSGGTLKLLDTIENIFNFVCTR